MYKRRNDRVRKRRKKEKMIKIEYMIPKRARV